MPDDPRLLFNRIIIIIVIINGPVDLEGCELTRDT